MSFPFLYPYREDITRARLAAVAPETADPSDTAPLALPAAERIWQWQAGTRNGRASQALEVFRSLTSGVATLVEKPLPKDKPLPHVPTAETVRKKAWRKMVETLRPEERRKRIAKEFDAMMRREIDNPIGDTELADWCTVRSEGEAQDYDAKRRAEIREIVNSVRHCGSGNWSSALREAEDVGDSPNESSTSVVFDQQERDAEDDATCDAMSLRSALERLAPSPKEDEITALPSIPSHLRGQTMTTKERNKLRKAKSMMV